MVLIYWMMKTLFPYITYIIPNPPAHKLKTQTKRKFWIITTNGKKPIITQGALVELNRYQFFRGKSKVNISL